MTELMKTILKLIALIFCALLTLYGVFRFFSGGNDYIFAALGIAGMIVFGGTGEKTSGNKDKSRHENDLHAAREINSNQTNMSCAQCGTAINAGERFCRKCGTAATLVLNSNTAHDRIPKPQMSSTGASLFAYAGFWKRVCASLIDIALLSALIYFLSTKGTVKYAQQERAAYYIIGLLYFAIMESSETQGTFGKGLLKIKVVDVYGNRISFFRAAGRHIGKMLSGLLVCIGFLMAAFTKKKQTLHDIMAGTLVVNEASADIPVKSANIDSSERTNNKIGTIVEFACLHCCASNKVLYENYNTAKCYKCGPVNSFV